MRTYHLVLAVVLLCAATLHAQNQSRTLTGTVYSYETSRPMPGLRFGVRNTDLQVETDRMGRYRVDVAQETPLVDFAEFVGMQVKEIRISDQQTVDLYLTSSLDLFDLPIDQLMKLPITTAARKEEKLGDIPASIVVLTRKDIELFGYRDLREILNNVPGYYAMSNLGVDLYGVRGFTKERETNFVVLINGIRMTDQRILKFYQVPVEAIDRIEIVRGPMSVIYGNNAFFGAINIITNSEHSPYVVGGLGTLGTRQMAAGTGLQEAGVQLSLNVALQRTDGPNFELADMISRPERMLEPLFGGAEGKGLDLPDYAQRTEDLLSKNQRYLDLAAAYRGFYLNTVYIEADNDWYYYYPSIDQGSRFRSRNLSMLAGYKYQVLPKLAVETKVKYAQMSAYQDYHHLFEGFYGWDTYTSGELEGELNLFWSPNKRWNITSGFHYENLFEHQNESNVPIAQIVNMSNYLIGPNDDGRVYAGYLQTDYSLGAKLKLIGGLRVEQRQPYRVKLLNYQGATPPAGAITLMEDRIEASDLELIPRLGLILTPSEKHIVKLLYGRAVKRPSYQTLADDMHDIVLGEKSSGFSKSEYIDTYELNYLASFGSNINLNISVFRNNLENLLVEKNEIVNGILRAWWANASQQTTNGAEATLMLGSKKTFYAELSGIYQQSMDQTVSPTVEASYSPQLIGYLKLAYTWRRQYTLGVLGNYVGQMEPFYNYSPRYDAAGQATGAYVGRTASAVPAYVQLSAQVRLAPDALRGLYMSFGCTNVLDTQIRYPSFSINQAWADRGTLGLGRMWYASLGFRLKTKNR